MCERTTGPIIEFGVGDYSTPYLEQLSRDTQRLVFSLETDREWWWKFREMHQYNHAVIWVGDYKQSIKELGQQWDVCFVDSSPEGERRVIVDGMRNNAKYIIVHDSEPEHESCYHLSGVLASFPYRSDRIPEGPRPWPWTTVLSMTQEV